MRQIKLIITTFLFLAPMAAQAVPILDQSQLDGSEQNQAIHSFRNVGQTITVGTAGLFDSIELSLFDTGSGADLVVTILDMSGGDLSLAPSLGSVSISEAALGASPLILSAAAVTATLIDISSLGIFVGVGDVLLDREQRLGQGSDDCSSHDQRDYVMSSDPAQPAARRRRRDGHGACGEDHRVRRRQVVRLGALADHQNRDRHERPPQRPVRPPES